MATYNGERFLREQLDSLLSQTFRDFRICIRDDGSSDSTPSIIEEYRSRNPEMIEICHDPVLHRGAAASFMHMLEEAQADYFMFCDQDDVWLPTKIEHTLGRMLEIEAQYPGKPVMIHTDLKVADGDLNVISPSFWGWRRYDPDLCRNFNFAVIGNVFTGCTMMINRPARDISIPMSPNSRMHDEWIGLKVAKSGHVDNLKEATMLYRQHGSNVCSAGTRKSRVPDGRGLKSLYSWYYDRKPLLDELGYGPVWKGVFYKILSLTKRTLR